MATRALKGTLLVAVVIVRSAATDPFCIDVGIVSVKVPPSSMVIEPALISKGVVISGAN